MNYASIFPLQALAMPVGNTTRLNMITYVDDEIEQALYAKNLMPRFWKYMEDVKLQAKIERNSEFEFKFEVNEVRTNLRIVFLCAFRQVFKTEVKIPLVLDECMVLLEKDTITTIDIYQGLELGCNLSTLSTKAQEQMETYLVYYYVKKHQPTINFLEGLQ